jgi:ABC-2 type transport system ATP-binding protein
VRWTRDGQRFVHSTTVATKFVHELFEQYGEAIGELEVRRASLEDTYMTLVRQAESGQVAGNTFADRVLSRDDTTVKAGAR